MQPFIYGIYDKVHIIDLNKTLEKLTLACKVIEGVVEKVVLFYMSVLIKIIHRFKKH